MVMRILLIAGEYPPLQGGLGDYTRELARALVVLGHAAHVYTKVATQKSITLVGDTVEDGVNVHRIAQHWNWSTLTALQRCVRDYKIDVVNLQYQAAAYQMHPAINMLPRWFARKFPVIVTFHDLRAPFLFPKAGALRERIILDMARQSAATIVTNAEDRQRLLLARVKNVAHIPIGSNIAPVKLDHFDRAAWLSAHNIPISSRVVGYFGFMNESKGGEVLIRALAELVKHQDVWLLLIGGQTGESDPTNVAYAQRIMLLADQLRVRNRIVMTGYVDDPAVSEALAVCDCVALPYRDGASFRRGTLMAALAHGCAVVTTTPRVALPELSNGENVLLVPPDDAQQLAEGIRRVLDDAALRQRLQAGSRQLSQLFTWDKIAADCVTVFEGASFR